jgi:hypothetical protein
VGYERLYRTLAKMPTATEEQRRVFRRKARDYQVERLRREIVETMGVTYAEACDLVRTIH